MSAGGFDATRNDWETPCPYCGTVTTCDVADVGVGYVQCGHFHCTACGASEIGPHDKPRELTDDEKRTGWYGPGAEPGSSANVIGGKIVSHTEMRDTYHAAFAGNPDYERPGAVEEWREAVRKPVAA
ncbi:hypothetical protein [Azospirillum sp. TSO5]|uniref:hypothetical protein n=1 Tax=Azospirillum sp. TSO5 TaxID=716760 RepID=UPI000D651AEB|nr:hypothetical protein [Azospirillum sp. TSO5]